MEFVRALLAGGRPAEATLAWRELERLFVRLLGRPPSPALRGLINP